jgi:predicted molibdopterin-dependent oxidoreductase YjgC
MFRFLQDDTNSEFVNVILEGSSVAVPANVTVAAAVLAQGMEYTRTSPVSGEPRLPLCMMGVCYECLMIIDGKPNLRACQQLVSEGMTIQRQHGTAGER